MLAYRPPLSLAIFAVLFVVILVFTGFHGILGYTESRYTLNEYTWSMVSQQRRTINQALSDKFSVQANLDQLAAQSIPTLYENGGLASVDRFLFSNLTYFDEISAAWFTTDDNEFSGYVYQADYLHMYANAETGFAINFAKSKAPGVDGPVVNSREGFFATQRPWYTSAIDPKTMGFSDVFTYHAYATLALPHSLPVYKKDGERLGVVGSNIFLGQFGGFLRELMAPLSGAAVILDNQGRLIASSLDISPLIAEENRSEMVVAATSDNPIIKSASSQPSIDLNVEQYGGTELPELPELTIEGVDYRTASYVFDQVPNLNWQIVLFVPKQDFHLSVEELIRQALAIMAITLLLALVLSLWLARNISHPITHLIERFSHIDENFDQVEEFASQRLELKEVTSLKSASIGYQQKLKGFVASLKQKIDENNHQLSQIKKLALVSQSIDDMSVIISGDGCLDWANYPFFDFFGLEKTTSENADFADLRAADSSRQDLLCQVYQHFTKYSHSQTQQRVQAAIDEHRHYELRFFPVTVDQTLPKVLILIRDISSQIAYQEELAIWKRVFESAKVGIAVSLGNNQFIDVVNQEFADIYGGTVEEYRGSDIATFYPEDAKHTPDQLREMVNEKGELAVETEHVRKNGERFPALLSATFVHSESGKILARVATVSDLSEPKQLQQQLFQSQKMHAIGSLAGGIVHDMNNVLGAILGNAELGLIFNKDNDNQITGKNNQLFQAVMNAAKRGSKLTQQVLSFTRMEAVKMAPVSISKLLRETMELVEATLPANIHLHLNSSLSEEDAVQGNESQLQQIFLNLLNNAIKAIQKTDVPEGQITVNADIDPQFRLLISISDNGCGIPEDLQPFVFDPFFTTEAKGKGTGLGLAIVKRIITAHQGDIVLHSEAGQGCQFDLWFNNVIYSEYTEEPGRSHDSKGPAECRIVIVDDDKAVLTVWSELFKLKGYQVDAFSDATQALAFCVQNAGDIDCIFTDFDMPLVNGETLCREVRKRKPNMNIIMATGFSELMSEDKARELGIAKLLFKPVAFEDLLAELEQVMASNH